MLHRYRDGEGFSGVDGDLAVDLSARYLAWEGSAESFLERIPEEPLVDLVVTSPPYNLGKSYESKTGLDHYLGWQESIITAIVSRLKPNGSLCWQVGNYVENGEIVPLDIELAPIFKRLGLRLRNRIVWRFGHGLHSKRRFSGRYEVVLWYTASDEYVFNLDAVRIPAKYPAKRHYKGPKAGELSGNPRGKNPEDVWDIPNVKANHVEKTEHPCQFPVGLVQRLVLALSDEGQVVLDPFSGVFTTGAVAAMHNRRFWGAELDPTYVRLGLKRMQQAVDGSLRFRPHEKPVYDPRGSKLSVVPEEWCTSE